MIIAIKITSTVTPMASVKRERRLGAELGSDPQAETGFRVFSWRGDETYNIIPVVPHKAVAEVSKIGNL